MQIVMQLKQTVSNFCRKLVAIVSSNLGGRGISHCFAPQVEFSGKTVFATGLAYSRDEQLAASSWKTSPASRIVLSGLIIAIFALVLGAASQAQAGAWSCGPYTTDHFQMIDGSNPSTWPIGFVATDVNSLSFSGDCTIRNFPDGFGTGTSLLNFNLPDKSAVIIMDNVYYTGNMSCSNLAPGVVIWWVNGSWNNINAKCQSFMPPVDGLIKQNPAVATTQTVGIPFTYTLTMPVMVKQNTDGTYTWSAQPDIAILQDINIYDDLTAAGTRLSDLSPPGADLTYVSNIAYVKSDPGAKFSLTNLGDNKHLHFKYNPINPGDQLVIELTVVLDKTNVGGTQFKNTATWTLDKLVTNQDGSTTGINDVPGMDGVTPPMTILAPNLVVNKSTSATAINLGDRRPSPSMPRTAAAVMPGTPRSSTISPPACAPPTPWPRSAPGSQADGSPWSGALTRVPTTQPPIAVASSI